jgi:hypothetical protein
VAAVARAMTLRIDEALAEEVDVARRVLDVPTVEFIRLAVAHYLEDLRDDPAFRRELSAMVERNAEALERARGRIV